MREKKNHRSLVAVFVLFLIFLAPFATASARDLKKPEEGPKGYVYESRHQDIVSKAKKEGSLRALLGLESASIAATKEAFSKKYPYIDCYFEEITGADAAERFLLEVQSGRPMDWDIVHITAEYYNKMQPYVEKMDLLSMAKAKILNIPVTMISPKDRNALGVAAIADIAGYNSKMLQADRVPQSYEDFLKPGLKGRKFVLDIKPNYLAGLVPAQGLEWTLDYARKLAAQEPIWTRGQTRALTAMAAGEYPLILGTYYHSLMRQRLKGMTHLEPVFLEPVSIRLAEVYGVRKGAKHPFSALLLLEFMASPEGQKVIDDTDPGKASVFAPGSMLEQAVAGRKLSVLDWEHFIKRDFYVGELTKAYGFPSADEKAKKKAKKKGE